MSTPQTPDELLDAVSNLTLRQFFPDFDELRPASKKLVRLVHEELVQGELSHRVFQNLIGMLLVLWDRSIRESQPSVLGAYSTPFGVRKEYLTEVYHYGKLLQYLETLKNTLAAMPDFPDGCKDRTFRIIRPPEEMR